MLMRNEKVLNEMRDENSRKNMTECSIFIFVQYISIEIHFVDRSVVMASQSSNKNNR